MTLTPYVYSSFVNNDQISASVDTFIPVTIDVSTESSFFTTDSTYVGLSGVSLSISFTPQNSLGFSNGKFQIEVPESNINSVTYL